MKKGGGGRGGHISENDLCSLYKWSVWGNFDLLTELYDELMY